MEGIGKWLTSWMTCYYVNTTWTKNETSVVQHTQLEHWSTWACDQKIRYTCAGLKINMFGKAVCNDARYSGIPEHKFVGLFEKVVEIVLNNNPSFFLWSMLLVSELWCKIKIYFSVKFWYILICKLLKQIDVVILIQLH